LDTIRFKRNWIIGLLWLIPLIMQCQREHANIFDPQFPVDSINLDLRIISSDSVVTLSWIPPGQVQYMGFNIYRQSEDSAQFSLLARVDRDQFQFNDLQTQYDKLYRYYLRIQGADSESPRSTIVQTVPGPFRVWILDRWNFYIYYLTYDLRHVIRTQYAVWRPQSMCRDEANQTAVITYPGYHYLELFRLADGTLLSGFDDLKYPFDCVFNAQTRTFWIADSSGGIYALSKDPMDIQQLNNLPRHPLQMIRGGENRFYVLDRKSRSISIFNALGERTGTINRGLNDPYYLAGSDFNLLYILDRQDSLTSNLVQYDPESNQLKEIYHGDNLALVKLSFDHHSLWLAQNNPSNAKILQLSLEGIRLSERKGFKFISDVTPAKNGHLLVADAGAALLFHFGKDKSLVGRFSKAYYPFKVYVE